VVACVLAVLAAFFAVRFPDVPGASIGSYVSTFLIALPSAVALFGYLGPRRAILSLLALSAFAYAIESFGVATGFPYGRFFYGDALGPTVAGLVPFLLPVSYVPLVVGAVAAAWGGPRPLHIAFSALILVWMDTVLDPGATSLGFWVWPGGGAYYGVPVSNFAGWLLSGAGPPSPTLLDSAAISTAFWTAVAAFSGIMLPALFGAALLIFLLVRRAFPHVAK
jgi:putative membrane protein